MTNDEIKINSPIFSNSIDTIDVFILSFKIHFEFTHSIVTRRLREKMMIYITELVDFGLQFLTVGGSAS